MHSPDFYVAAHHSEQLSLLIDPPYHLQLITLDPLPAIPIPVRQPVFEHRYSNVLAPLRFPTPATGALPPLLQNPIFLHAFCAGRTSPTPNSPVWQPPSPPWQPASPLSYSSPNPFWRPDLPACRHHDNLRIARGRAWPDCLSCRNRIIAASDDSILSILPSPCPAELPGLPPMQTRRSTRRADENAPPANTAAGNRVRPTASSKPSTSSIPLLKRAASANVVPTETKADKDLKKRSALGEVTNGKPADKLKGKAVREERKPLITTSSAQQIPQIIGRRTRSSLATTVKVEEKPAVPVQKRKATIASTRSRSTTASTSTEDRIARPLRDRAVNAEKVEEPEPVRKKRKTSSPALEEVLDDEVDLDNDELYDEDGKEVVLSSGGRGTALRSPKRSRAKDDGWTDLDAEDEHDPSMVSEYVVDAFTYMMELEVSRFLLSERPTLTSSDKQCHKSITWTTRPSSSGRCEPSSWTGSSRSTANSAFSPRRSSSPPTSSTDSSRHESSPSPSSSSSVSPPSLLPQNTRRSSVHPSHTSSTCPMEGSMFRRCSRRSDTCSTHSASTSRIPTPSTSFDVSPKPTDTTSKRVRYRNTLSKSHAWRGV